MVTLGTVRHTTHTDTQETRKVGLCPCNNQADKNQKHKETCCSKSESTIDRKGMVDGNDSSANQRTNSLGLYANWKEV